MEELTKSILINELFDLYESLLSKTQQKMIYLYYNLDLSLKEIAEQENVSRNAVYDALKKGTESLFDFEEKLNLHKKFESLKEILSDEDYQKVISLLKGE